MFFGQQWHLSPRKKGFQMDIESRFRPLRLPATSLTLLLLMCILPAAAHAQGRPTSILVLHQAAGDSAGLDLFVSGLRAQMERESAAPVFIYEEALDRYEGATDRSQGKNNPSHLAAHLNLLGTKYRNRKIDVIVPVGPDFLIFSEKYKEMFAPQAKIVYLAES